MTLPFVVGLDEHGAGEDADDVGAAFEALSLGLTDRRTMAAYFTVNTTKLNGSRNYTTPRDVTPLRVRTFRAQDASRVTW